MHFLNMNNENQAIFWDDSGGDFAAQYREDILKEIRVLESKLTKDNDYYEVEKILFYIVILTTLIQNVSFEDSANEFAVLEEDLEFIRNLKIKFLECWDHWIDDWEEEQAYLMKRRKLIEATFDNLIRISEDPPEY